MRISRIYSPFLILFLLVFLNPDLEAQMITGSWKGKINRQKVEVKIIQKGDSLVGTSYYFESPNNYRRYTIKGYFDQETNSAVWWDDQLIEERSGRFSISIPGKIPMLSRADFNCPGGGRMMLDGKAAKREEETVITGEVHLDKIEQSSFEDDWDFVIDNYLVGGNDPDLIDSIQSLSNRQPEKVVASNPPVRDPIDAVVVTREPIKKVETPATVKSEPKPEQTATSVSLPAPTIEQKFVTRKKILTREIPVTGDSIELRFYDNAEIDGDSISLFLNDKLIFQHIRLTGNAYTIKLAVSELKESNELIMVAENLGAIPPNTSYMVAIVGELRYDAYLTSNEGSSAMIRFVRK